MLSILIPTYNYNVFPLAENLYAQCRASGVDFEIIVIDDGSDGFQEENSAINNLENCRYERLPHNIGRSRIRNLLGTKAKYKYLLFLDADVMPVNQDFITAYLTSANDAKVVSGGLKYRDNKPSKTKLLRWTYGSQREAIPAKYRRRKPYQSLLSSNFLIHHATFTINPFEEDMPDLRREDTLFSYHLMQQNVPVFHIDNPVYHDGLDDFESAIEKEHQSLEGLLLMIRRNWLPADYTKMSRLFQTIEKSGMRKIVGTIFLKSKTTLLKNLSGDNPSMTLFDLYRVGYLCSITNKH